MLVNLQPRVPVPLAIENHGQYTLTGISVTTYDSSIWLPMTHRSILNSVQNRLGVGTLHKEERLVLNSQIEPEKYLAIDDAKSQFRVFISVTAQNFTTSEYLDFKKDASGGWVFRYKVFKQNQMPDIARAAKKKQIAKEQFLEAVDWSSNANSPVLVDAGESCRVALNYFVATSRVHRSFASLRMTGIITSDDVISILRAKL